MTEIAPTISSPILFFDGVCGLCDHFVTFLVTRDSRHILRFAPLQGETAHQSLHGSLTESLTTVVLKVDGQLYTKSDAAVRALVLLGGAWVVAKVLLWIPRSMRDWIYEVVASRRYLIFGRKDVCRVPTPAERPYFLK